MRQSNIIVACGIMAVTAVGTADLQAQRPDIRFGPQLSLAEDADVGIGGRLEIGLPRAPVSIWGSFDLFFPDGPADYWEFNANASYDFHLPTTPTVVPYAGGGLNIAHISVGPADDTDAGLNLLGGVRFPLPSVMPFFELRIELGGGEMFVATGGVLF